MSNVDEQIHDALERIGGEGVGPSWDSVLSRRRRRRARRAALGAAAVVLVGVAAAVGIDDRVDSHRGTTQVVTADDPESAPSTTAPAPVVGVSVRGEGLGPLIVESSPLESAGDGSLVHTITLSNPTDEVVYVDDPRASALLGDLEVVAATEGCGYSVGQGGPVVAGMCRLDYAPLAIQPGGSVELPITLWRGLVGMNPAVHESYEWELEVRTNDVAFSRPDQGGTLGVLVITYGGLDDIEDHSALGAGGLPDGPHFALVESIVSVERGWRIRLQPAQLLSGEEAAQAALDDGAITSRLELPDDVYIRRVGEPVVVSVDGAVPPLTVVESDAPAELGWDAFVDGYGPSPEPGFAPLPVWLTVEDGQVIALEQQYIP